MRIEAMEIGVGGILLIIVLAAVVPWAIASALGRVDAGVTLSGLRNGLIVAVLIGAAVGVLVALFNNGDAEEIGISSAGIGAIIGVFVGFAYFWLGSTLIPIGLIFKAKPAWSTVGAWAAVPIIVVSLGLGYTAYRSADDSSATQTTANGTVQLSLNTGGVRPISASGVATCSTDKSGSESVVAGTKGNAAIMSTEGTVVQITFDLEPGATNPSIVLTVANESAMPGKGWDASPQTIALDPGSNMIGGHATLTGLVPHGADGQPVPNTTWSGDFTWLCKA
jgi:hypothetical protein